MASATLATPVSVVPAAAQGDSSQVLVCGEEAIAATAGNGSHARAQGKSAIAVAGGSRARATILPGKEAEALAAAGPSCVAECFDGYAYMAAVGLGPIAISHALGCPAVAVGHDPLAIAGPGGIAVSVGYYPIAQAGEGGTLVFVDTASKGGPFIASFLVGTKNPSSEGPAILPPDTPYTWNADWLFPELWEED